MTANPSPLSQEEATTIANSILKTNAFEIGDHFRNLMKGGFQEWERPLFFMLARSYGYIQNDQTKLLEFAKEVRHVAQIKMDFVNRHLTEIFLPGAAAHEEAQVRFLNEKIIPFLESQQTRPATI